MRNNINTSIKENGLKAFTLIELIVVITIMIILTGLSYTPFSHYKTKQQVRNSAKIISQTLYNARNSAIYGLASSSGNLDIGVLLKSGKNNLGIYGFPIKDNIGDYTNPDNKYLLEKIPLEKNVYITSSGALILYKAVSGSGIYKGSFDYDGDKIILKVGFKKVKTGIMTNKIIYYTKTYISDITK